ncbi:MAG TPA: hypothetical protein VHB74_05670 [Devosia sp.]|nr:hypothetical protein [Devosia sp.]
MTVKTRLVTLAAAGGMLALSAAAAFASPGVIAYPSSLYAHPGIFKIGAVFPGQHVDVGPCFKGYCFVSKPGKDGFVKISAIKWFGGPYGPLPPYGPFGPFGPWW